MKANHWNAGRQLRALLLTLALLLAPLLGLAATPAQAASGDCTTSGTTVTCTFDFTGAAQTWIVPAGVAQAKFDLYGAQGGFGWHDGGQGGAATATLTVTPGQTFQINVGGRGGDAKSPYVPDTSSPGGFNGGGAVVGHHNCPGGGGGGASDVRWDDPLLPGTFTLAERLLVAGGGGGDSPFMDDGAGGGGGLSGGAGTPDLSRFGAEGGGGGGSQTAGGAGGIYLSYPSGSGDLGVGGDAGECGGAGGGGYYGGGGGVVGGGGGGSGYGPAGVVFQTGVRGGDGLVIITYSPDSTPPAIAPTISGTLGNNNWYTSDVAVSWTVADEELTITTQSGCDAQSVTSDTTGVTFTCSSTSLGGTASQSVTIQRDATAPTISAAATSSPNANGWYKGDVAVAFSCHDTLSGTASCPAPQTLSGEGTSISSSAQSVSDRAGNASTPSNIITVQIDRNAPSVSVTGVTNGATYLLGSVPTAGCSTTDNLSNVATQATLRITGGNADGTGSFTATCAGATDKAGNSGSASVSYTVAYRWSGFFQPIDNLPTVNSVKAGQAIPVTFSLGGNYGLSIFAPGYPKVQLVACSSGAPTDEIEQTVTAGASGLQYDAASGQYLYTWKTDKAWAGTCRQLVLKLSDGTEHIAGFQFR